MLVPPGSELWAEMDGGDDYACNEQDPATRVLFFEMNREIDPRKPRHYHIRDKQIGRRRPGGFQSFQRVHKAASVVTIGLQNARERGRDEEFIIHYEDM